PILRVVCSLYYGEADWDGRWWGTRPDTAGPYFKPVTWEGTNEALAVLQHELKRADPQGIRTLLVELQRHRISLPEAVPVAIKLAAEDATFRCPAADLLGRMTPMPPEAIGLLEETASSSKEESGIQTRALTTL